MLHRKVLTDSIVTTNYCENEKEALCNKEGLDPKMFEVVSHKIKLDGKKVLSERTSFRPIRTNTENYYS